MWFGTSRKDTRRQISCRRTRGLGSLLVAIEPLESRTLLSASTVGDLDGHAMPPDLRAAGVAVSPHVGDAPVGPPEKNDHTFFVDVAPLLDTGCSFRSDVPSGRLEFEIPIDRVIGNLDLLMKNDLISKMAHLTMPAYDVDFDGGGAAVPEQDRVTINGHVVSGKYLTGTSDTWKTNEFDIPIDWLKFPTDARQPEMNKIVVDIDVLSTEDTWCTSIDWASLEIEKIAPPVLLVHGILSGASTWASPWQNRLTNELGVLNDAIDLGSDEGLLVLDSIEQNAQDIAARVNELSEQWGVDKFNIVSHSKGGLDSRQFAEVSDKVGTLIQLGTPNAGSPWADLAQAGVITFTGVLGSALANLLSGPGGQQLTQPYMAYYNSFHGQSPNTLYLSQAGDYQFGSGFFNRLADAVIYSIMLGPSDAVVPVRSVNSLPYGIKVAPLQTSGLATDALHTGMTRSAELYDSFNALATLPVTASAVTTTEESPVPFASTGDTAGAVGQNETVTQQVTVDGTAPFRFSMMHVAGALDFRLRSPSGFEITPQIADSDADIDFDVVSPQDAPFGLQVYEVRGARAEAGTWTVRVTGNMVVNTAGVEPYFINAWAEAAAIQLAATLSENEYHAGDPLVIRAEVSNTGTPITSASVHAEIVLPDGMLTSISLVDDGTGDDATAGDGAYAGRLSGTSAAGMYRILVRATGTTPVAFERSQFLLAPVSASHSTLTHRFTDQGVDTNGNGLFDELVVNAEFQVDVAAQYRYLAVLRASDGTELDQVSGRVSLTPGMHNLSLTFDGNRIFQSRMNGPYQLSVVRVAEDDGLNLMPLVDETDLFETTAYDYLAFEHPSLFSFGTGTDEGVDFNGNGLLDRLLVRPELLVANAGQYSWSARLEDAAGVEIGFASGRGFLPAGTATIELGFSGLMIGQHGVDGPYVLRDLLIFGSGGSANLSEVYSTRGYAAREFEGFALSGPTNLAALPVSANQMDLSWQVPAGAIGIDVFVWQGSAFQLLDSLSPAATAFQHTGLTPGTFYLYAVRALFADGSSADAFVSSATLPTAPVPPDHLAATPLSPSQVSLTWTAPANATGFDIFVWEGKRFIKLASLSPANTSYLHDGLSANTFYLYAVRALYAGGGEAETYARTITPNPSTLAPTHLRAFVANASEIELSWHLRRDVAQVDVFVWSGNRFLLLQSLPGTATFTARKSLNPGTYYLFAVRAIYANGDSAEDYVDAVTPL